MRKVAALLLCAALLLGLAACGGGEVVADLSAHELAKSIWATQGEPDEMTWLTAQDEAFSTYVFERYGIQSNMWTDGALCYAEGLRADEILALRLTEDADMAAEKNALTDYVRLRGADFFGYAPEETARLEAAKIRNHGRYLVLMICGDVDAADAAFDAAFDAPSSTDPAAPSAAVASPAPRTRSADWEPALDARGYIVCDPPKEHEMPIFDTAPLVRAWQTGDTAALSQEEQVIYAVCEAAIAERVTPEMTPAQREFALYDWMLGWADYDQRDYAKMTAEQQRICSEPYGLLADKKAICMGYANGFQLLMDLVEVECITVVGASDHSRGDHAWNMVKLDGEWYCVDPTWDDPALRSNETPSPAGERGYVFFNVTSDAMRRSGHQWDYDVVPEATAEAYAFQNTRG